MAQCLLHLPSLLYKHISHPACRRPWSNYLPCWPVSGSPKPFGQTALTQTGVGHPAQSNPDKYLIFALQLAILFQARHHVPSTRTSGSALPVHFSSLSLLLSHGPQCSSMPLCTIRPLLPCLSLPLAMNDLVTFVSHLRLYPPTVCPRMMYQVTCGLEDRPSQAESPVNESRDYITRDPH
jgi:hypothetical protein